jgi:hypothetical protein
LLRIETAWHGAFAILFGFGIDVLRLLALGLLSLGFEFLHLAPQLLNFNL